MDLMGKTMKEDLKLQHAMETDESPNVLLGAGCVQSSVCDGLDGDRAVDLDKSTFSRTQREKEAWWEAQLDPQSNPIREVIVTLVTPNRAPVHVLPCSRPSVKVGCRMLARGVSKSSWVKAKE